ncbi:hypothetical protein [Azonexus sp.]|jgi:glycine cleavage system H protein|uniref:hypothetical protein n=1 Tax=Azonexus sp. TaxID=1872668 RepID=UPI0028251F86|nr:hypothetical protein [Azonexus sp.]MDR1995793.1 hypothetical protein [Azonexus sp.]
MSHTPFSGTIPDDRLYCPAHNMWGQEAGDGTVLIGSTAFVARSVDPAWRTLVY